MDSQENQPQMSLIIAEINDACLYRLIQNNRNKLYTAVGRLAKQQENNTYFITIDKFSQNIVAGTPFVQVNTEKGVTLIFPHISEGLNGLYLPKNVQQEYFLSMLASVVQVIPYDQAVQIQEFKDAFDMHCANINQIPLEQSDNIIVYIQKGGEQLKTGLTWFGGVVANAINSGGQYINSKIEPGQSYQVSDSTKSGFTTFKEKAGQAAQVTSKVFLQLFEPVAEKTKELTNQLGQKIDSSDNKYLKEGKTITVATWGAAGKALEGIGAVFNEVGNSITSNTKQIVEKKFGSEVTQTFLGSEQSQVQQELQQPLIEESQNSNIVFVESDIKNKQDQ